MAIVGRLDRPQDPIGRWQTAIGRTRLSSQADRDFGQLPFVIGDARDLQRGIDLFVEFLDVPSALGVTSTLQLTLEFLQRDRFAASVFLEGECVVDVWGGQARHDGTPWERDTMATSFSNPSIPLVLAR